MACVAIIASLLTLLAAFIPEVKGMVSYNYGATITIIVTIPAVAFALAYRNRKRIVFLLGLSSLVLLTMSFWIDTERLGGALCGDALIGHIATWKTACATDRDGGIDKIHASPEGRWASKSSQL